ncbi:MAG: FHA domain-containing protein [Deltaproteobacteria bacterium]|nr:FHA domain-containing protein [Deltaproteobacteria bacterium]
MTDRLLVQEGARKWEVVLADAAVVVGRADSANVKATYASASQLHCRIEQVGGSWTVIDLGSTNGTFVNDGPRLTGRVTLRHGDRVRCGPAGGLELLVELAVRRTLPLVLPPEMLRKPPAPVPPAPKPPEPKPPEPKPPEPPPAPDPGELGQVRAKLAQALGELDEQHRLVDRARGELDAEREQLREAQATLEDLRQELLAMRELWQEAEARLVEADKVAAPLRGRSGELEAKAAAMRPRIEQLEAELREAEAARQAAEQRAELLRQAQTQQADECEELRRVVTGQLARIAALELELAQARHAAQR